MTTVAGWFPTAATTPAHVNPLDDPLIRRLAAVVIIGSFMSVLDTTIVNVAIDIEPGYPLAALDHPLGDHRHPLALALVIPMSWISFRVVQHFGSPAYVAGVVLFTLGSALCGLAWSPASLIVFRFLQ